MVLLYPPSEKLTGRPLKGRCPRRKLEKELGIVSLKLEPERATVYTVVTAGAQIAAARGSATNIPRRPSVPLEEAAVGSRQSDMKV